MKQPINTGSALAMMTTGMVTALTWRLGWGLADSVCEALPGMVAGAMVYLIARVVSHNFSTPHLESEAEASHLPRLGLNRALSREEDS